MNTDYDIIIVGGGPAGLTAAIYALRGGKKVLVCEKENFGGQMTFSPKIENYPGFVSISGSELAQKMVEQAVSQGAEFSMEEVVEIKADGNVKTITTDMGKYTAKAVILAVGVKHRLLHVPGEDTFLGSGISFCAICDGAFYEGKDVIVVGGGNSALQEAILLSKTSKSVTMVQNLDFLTGDAKLIEVIGKTGNIKVITGYVAAEVMGDTEVTGLKIKAVKDGSEEIVRGDGIFTAIGLEPCNIRFENVVKLSDRGYIQADGDGITDMAGVYAAGDCRTKKVRQVSSAASDGACAAVSACEYIDHGEF